MPVVTSDVLRSIGNGQLIRFLYMDLLYVLLHVLIKPLPLVLLIRQLIYLRYRRALSSVFFGCGQPLAYLSLCPLFALFALSHHLLMWYAAEQVYFGQKFSRYALRYCRGSSGLHEVEDGGKSVFLFFLRQNSQSVFVYVGCRNT